MALFCSTEHPICFVKQPCKYNKNIIEGCSLSQRQSGQIFCPSAYEADEGALLAECQSMTTLQRASGWPSRHNRHSSRTLVVSQSQQKTWLLLPHLQRSWATRAEQLWRQQVWVLSCTYAQFNSAWFSWECSYTKCVFVRQPSNVKSIFQNFMHSSQSSHCPRGLWLISSGWQGSKGLGSAATGTGGKMSGSLHTSRAALQGTLTQISLLHQHSMVWHIRSHSNN